MTDFGAIQRKGQEEETIPTDVPDKRADHSEDLGSVLTPEEMQELWHDIEEMVTPSWSTSVPINLGRPAHGKLKADQWRIIGSTYLPATLIRLWSQADEEHQPESEKRREYLDFTMTLLSAINIATSRVTSVANSEEYENLMFKYRKQLRELFPNYSAKPNHHIAMHLGEYLRMYGPVYGWWTFPFERLIGTLQRISTNYKPGAVALISCIRFAANDRAQDNTRKRLDGRIIGLPICRRYSPRIPAPTCSSSARGCSTDWSLLKCEIHS